MTCRKCGKDKPLSEFSTWFSKARSRTYRRKICRTCKMQGNRRSRKGDRWARTREKFSTWYDDLKAGPCADCGHRFHPCVMQWDHRPGTEKVAAVSTLYRTLRSREVILAEIAKCDLVCANCHALRTFNRSQKGKE